MFDRESKDLQDRKAVFSVNSAICCQYAKLFRELIDTPYYGHLCNEALLAYHRFYKAPAKEYVEALEGITFSTSESLSEPILKKDSILHIILSRKKTRWWWANMIYNITCPDLFTFLLRSVSKLNEWIRST